MNEVNKIYYSMTEVQQMTGLSASNLRFWEKHFTQLTPRKDGHGNRYYTQEDIDLIKQIKYIRDDLQITRIDAIRRELKNDKRQVEFRQRATDILLRVRQELVDIRKNL